MVEIVWLPSFETGLPEIDDEHKKLVESIRLIESAVKEKNIERFTALFKDFTSQAKTHFKNEETYLVSIDFPRIESHTAAHKKLLELAERTLTIVEAGPDIEEASKCLEEVTYLLLEDVIKADADFKSYAQENGIL